MEHTHFHISATVELIEFELVSIDNWHLNYIKKIIFFTYNIFP